MNINLTKNTSDKTESGQYLFNSKISASSNLGRNPSMMNQSNQREKDNFFGGANGIDRDEVKEKGVSRILSAIISVSMFMIFFGFPLFFIGKTFQGLTLEKMLFFYFWLLLGLVAWATKGIISREMKIARTPLDIPLLIFWVVCLISAIFSVDRWHSFFGFFGGSATGLLNVTALIAMYFLLMSNFDKGKFKLIIYGLVSSIFIVNIWTILAILGIKFLPDALVNYAPLSLIGSLTSAGTFFTIAMPILLAFIFSLTTPASVKKGKLSLVIFGIITLLANMFIISAIYGFVNEWALLVGIFVFLIFIISRIVRPSSEWTWLGFIVFIVVMVIVFSNGFKIAKITMPVEVTPRHSVSWSVVKDSAKENFFFGSGLSTYGYDFSKFKPVEYNLESLYTLKFYQATSIFFESMATIGAIGTIAFVILVLSFLSISGYLLSIDKEKNKIWSLGLSVAVLIFIVSAFFNQIEGVILTFGSLLAILSVAVLMSESVEDRKYLNLSLKASPKFALALAFIFMVVTAGVVFMFVYMGNVLIAEINVGKDAREKEITEDGSINYLMSAINRYDKEGRYYTKLGQEYMVLANQEMLKSDSERDLKKIGNYLNLAIEFSKIGVDKMPNDVLAVESLAQIYENSSLYVSNSLELADETYKKALELDPNSPLYMLKLGQINIYDANKPENEAKKDALIDEAIKWFEKAVEKKKNLPDAYYHLGLSKELKGDLDEAINNLTKAVSLDRQNINFVFNLARLYQARKGDEDVKIAEALYKKILGVNDKEINTHFSLANLYEQTNRNSEAIEEYKKVLDLLPEGSQDARDKINEMVSNLEQGKSNFGLNSNVDTSALPAIDESVNENVEAEEVAPDEIPATTDSGEALQ